MNTYETEHPNKGNMNRLIVAYMGCDLEPLGLLEASDMMLMELEEFWNDVPSSTRRLLALLAVGLMKRHANEVTK
jgi:hypothetical protein